MKGMNTQKLATLTLLGALSIGATASAQGDAALAKAKELEAAIVKVVTRTSPTFVVIGGGSGVCISADGWMLTNHHVAGSRSIGSDWQVKLPGRGIFKATMIGTDPVGDISLLKIKIKKKGQSFPFVELGDSDACKVGDWAVALGNPFGFAKDSTPTVTVGLLSAVNRYHNNYGDAIQTDAAINSGNSGGPLLDIQGRLIGINGQINTRHGVKINSGVGYAISVNQIKRFMKSLKAGGVVAHGRVEGLTTTNNGLGNGALVAGVDGGTAAARAGFKKDDLILEVSGLPIWGEARFLGAVSTFPAGDELTIVVLRAGEKTSLKVALADNYGGGRTNAARGGYMGVRMEDADNGVKIAEIVAPSPAGDAGLKADDVIVAFEGQTIQSTRELVQLLRATKAGQKVSVSVRRGAEEMKLVVTLGKRPS
jgi:serine protease Do